MQIKQNQRKHITVELIVPTNTVVLLGRKTCVTSPCGGDKALHFLDLAIRCAIVGKNDEMQGTDSFSMSDVVSISNISQKNGSSIGLNAFLLRTQARSSKPCILFLHLLSELRLQKI
jgi:hypothetical protein